MPRLQARHSAIVSTFTISVYWSLWHIPKYFIAGQGQNDWMQEAGFLSAFLGYSLFIFAWSIIYTWLFNNTRGSVLIAAVMHGAGNTWFGYLDNYRGDINNLWILAILTLALAAILIIVAGPEHLSRRHKRNTLELETASPGKTLPIAETSDVQEISGQV